MNRFALYVRGDKVAPDSGSISAALEFIIPKKKDREWVVGRIGKLIDPANNTTERAINSFLQDLSTKAPTAGEMIDFIEEAEEISVEVVNPMTEAILRTASEAFVNELGDHFTLDNKRVSINPSNPPDLQTCYRVIGQLAEMQTVGSKLVEFGTWRLGALADACETYFNNEFSISQVVAATPYAYNTVVTALSVYRKFGMEPFPLSYTHHKEVLYRKIPDDQQMAALRLASDLQLTCGETRKLCSFIQHAKHGIDSLTSEQKSSKGELMNILNQRSGARSFLFQKDGEWTYFKGHVDELPEDAGIVIDLGLKAYVNREDPSSKPKKLPEWKLDLSAPQPSQN